MLIKRKSIQNTEVNDSFIQISNCSMQGEVARHYQEALLKSNKNKIKRQLQLKTKTTKNDMRQNVKMLPFLTEQNGLGSDDGKLNQIGIRDQGLSE